MALAGPKNIRRREPEVRELGVKANAVIQQGGLVVNDGGVVAPGRVAVGLVSLGVAIAAVDNTGGADGAQRVPVRAGCYRFESASGDPVTAASIGKPVFIVDDETVSATDGSGAQSAAGKCFDVEDDFVWVTVGVA